MVKLAAIVFRHWKLLLALNLVVIGGVAASTIRSPKAWTANAQLILPDTGGRLEANLGTLGSLQNSEGIFSSTQVNPLKIQSSILTSDLLLSEVLARDPEKDQFPGVEGFKKLFKVAPQESTTVIGLSVVGSSPDIARQRTITWLEAYQRRLDELRQANNAVREQYNQKEIEIASQQLQQAQGALAEFKSSTGLVNSEEQTRGIVETMTALTTARAQAIAQTEASRNKAKDLSARLRLDPDQGVRSLSLSENPDYQYIRQKLVELDATLVQLRSRFTDTNPNVSKLLEQRTELIQRMNRYVAQASGSAQIDVNISSSKDGRSALIQQLVLAAADTVSSQRQAEQLGLQMTQLNNRLKSFPVSQIKILDLQRQADVAEGVYKGLVAQVQKSKIDAFNAYPNVQVLDLPTVDAKPTSPKQSMALLNALMACLVSSGALLLLLESRNPLLNPQDLAVFRFPLIVRVPRLKASSLGVRLKAETEIEFQRLASTLSLHSLENRRLLVTSAIVGEGKTTIVLQLAKALTDLGFRVLLVDGDFRRATLSQQLGHSQDLSLPESPIQIESRLDLLPTIPQTGRFVDLITRGQFEQTLKAAEAKADYDYVLVDSAPISLSSETTLMIPDVPNVLFVVRPGVSARNPARDCLEQLVQHNAKLLALVVNGEEAKARPYASRATDAANNPRSGVREKWGEGQI